MAAAFSVVMTQLEKLEKVEPMTFVAGSGLTPAARRALRMVRPFVEVADVPRLAPKGIAGLPSGHFLVYSFTVTGNVAEFEGTLGPVPAGPPRLNCGSGYRTQLERVANGWKVGKSVFINC